MHGSKIPKVVNLSNCLNLIAFRALWRRTDVLGVLVLHDDLKKARLDTGLTTLRPLKSSVLTKLVEPH